jgi:tRNA G46 methylase TrmB
MNTGKMKTNNTTDFASMYANLSKACLFTGKCAEAQKWLDCALTALESSKSSQLRNSMQQNRENESRKSNNEDGLKDAKRSKSIDLFLRHRRAEIESEVESISHCLSALRSLPSLRVKGAQEQALKIGFMHTLSRVLHFGFNGSGDHDDCCYPGDGDAHHVSAASTSAANPLIEEVMSSNALILAVKDKFGLDRVLETQSPGSNALETLHADHQLLFRECKDDVAAKLSRSVVKDTGFIDFNELFSTVKRSQSATSSSAMDVTVTSDEEDVEVETDIRENALPVNIEICSGSGEWVVSHAASDLYYRTGKHAPSGASPRALWLALELRCDRVYHTICRSVLENIVRHSQHAGEASIADSGHVQSSPPPPLSLGGLPNLAVIGGDASHILPNRIAPGSIANVYINHPEPPERTGGVGDSEGQHLLTQSFFSEIHRILSNEGKCTIVTDNLPYAKSLLQALGKTAVTEAKSPSSSSGKVYFSSVSLPSSDSDSKGRVLEDEVVISTSQSSSSTANQSKEDVKNKAKMEAKRSSSINSSDDDEDDDGDEDKVGNDDEDDFTYINDEDAVPVNGDIKSVNNKTKLKAKKSQKNAPRGSIKRNKISQIASVESAHKGLESKIQVLQLWRGDSAEGNDDDNNGDDRASSYFDRMWERGQKKRRYFMVLQKG